MLIRMFTVFLLVVMVGCAAVQPIDVSDSEKKVTVFPAHYGLKQIMRLFPEPYAIQIMAVDGIALKKAKHYSRRPVIVAEGPHVLTVRILPPNVGGIAGYMGADYRANKSLMDVSFNAESGKRYVVKARVQIMDSFLGTKMPMSYEFSIEEYEGTSYPEYLLDY